MMMKTLEVRTMRVVKFNPLHLSQIASKTSIVHLTRVISMILKMMRKKKAARTSRN